MRPRRLKFGTHMDNEQMYCVYQNQAASAYWSLYFFIFLSLQFSTLEFFVTLFSGTVSPRRLKLGKHVDSGKMYCVYCNQAAAVYSSLYFSFFFSQTFKHENFSSHFSQELWGLKDWNMLHMWKMGRCMVYTGIMLLLLFVPSFFSFFFLSSFQTLKFFVTLCSQTVRPRRLKLGTNVDSGQHVSCILESGCCCLFILYLFIFFLSNFQRLKIFFTLFSGTVRPRRLKLGRHMGRCIVYISIRLLLHICPFISSFFFLSNFLTLKFFINFFSGTVKPRKLKFGTHIDNEQMYYVYRNLLLIHPFIFHFSFSPIFKHQNFSSHFSLELWALEGWNLLYAWKMGGCIVYTRIMLLLLFVPLLFHFYLSPVFKH